ncbi:hypothetical protein [Coraliomargarita akajimensis]|nr:hypothetical protein [Coraliomargarita akajimensis]
MLIAFSQGVDASLPFAEDFETYAENQSIRELNNWQQEGSGSAVAQSASTHSGSYALEARDEVRLQQALSSNAGVVWSDQHIRFAATVAGTTPALPDTASAAVFLDANGQLNVADGNQWTIPSGITAVSLTEWHRVTLKLDYGLQTYSVWLNDVQVATNLSFVNAVASFAGIELDHNLEASTYLDDISAGTTEPSELDNDGDGLSNSWEQANGLDANDDGSSNSANGAMGNPDGDALLNLEELAFDTDPNASDSHLGPYQQVSEFESTDYFGIVYRESQLTSRIDYTAQFRNSLSTGDWASLAGERRVLDADPDGDGSCQLIEIRVPMDTDAKFLRLSLQTPN